MPEWTDERAAARLLHGKSLEAWIDELALLERIAVPFAQRGDLVLITTAERDSLAVCNGASAVGPGVDHLEFIPMDAARAAWRI